MYDIIGDIHGHYSELVRLLEKMGYEACDHYYVHPEGRQVIFVGDYIDRGPQIRNCLELVKGMVDHGQAIALMGNHEYNAILFNTLNQEKGGYLRKHSIKNMVQHYETIVQFKGDNKAYRMYMDWLMTLPIFYENDHFRVVHACWDDRCIDFLKKELGGNLLTADFLKKAVVQGTRDYSDVNDTLKGKEASLPSGNFLDSDGFERDKLRVRWWENPKRLSWEAYSVMPLPNLSQDLVGAGKYYYPTTAKPVFFGHYWLKESPKLMAANACCLDYSVAKGYKLVAYRWNGEEQLDEQHLIWVDV